ncbi:hypothetical protein ACLOJK_022849 [Asimina triloba]
MTSPKKEPRATLEGISRCVRLKRSSIEIAGNQSTNYVRKQQRLRSKFELREEILPLELSGEEICLGFQVHKEGFAYGAKSNTLKNPDFGALVKDNDLGFTVTLQCVAIVGDVSENT